MSSTHTTLDAAATDRKARLAKLASLKRKQPGSATTIAVDDQEGGDQTTTATTTKPESESKPESQSESESEYKPSKTDVYLSGRNYDTQTKGPKLGFEKAPHSADQEETVESQARRLTLETTEQAVRHEQEEADRGGIDLFRLRPRKPNWDLKRDLAEKTRVLDVRTQNAIARLVRDRIEKAKREALSVSASAATATSGDNGEELGLDGNTLVEGVHLREREEEEEEKRNRELELEEAVS